MNITHHMNSCVLATVIVYLAVLKFSRPISANNVTATEQQVTGSPSKSTDQTYVGSQCFQVRGVPTLRLQCPPTASGLQQLVHVRQAFYGVPVASATTAGNGNGSCVYREEENHCVQLADLPPGHQCNGRSQCSVHVSNPYLMNCRQYAVYMQINYTCVPKTNTIDVCSSTSLEAPSGYLRSPSYPEAPLQNPSMRQLCQCQVRAAVSDASERSLTTVVTARILDLSLALPVRVTPTQEPDEGGRDENDSCQSNYLHVTGMDRRCAGHATADLPETVDVDVSSGETLLVEFRSEPDRQQLDRGFWIDFSTNDGSDVKVTCEKLWSEELPDFHGPQRPFRPRPATSPSSVEHEAAAATLLPAAPENPAMPANNGNENGFEGHIKTSERHQELANTASDEAGFRLHDIEMIPVQPWLPAWFDDDDDASNEPEASNATGDEHRQLSTPSPVDSLRQPSNAAGRRPPVAGSVDSTEVVSQHRNPVAAGVPFLHRGQLVEHRVQDISKGINSHQNNYWFDFDNETRKSAAAIVGDGSEIFENRDFSRARESLKYNVDEVQIVTGIVIGILILVAICIIIILVFRRK